MPMNVTAGIAGDRASVRDANCVAATAAIAPRKSRRLMSVTIGSELGEVRSLAHPIFLANVNGVKDAGSASTPSW